MYVYLLTVHGKKAKSDTKEFLYAVAPLFYTIYYLESLGFEQIDFVLQINISYFLIFFFVNSMPNKYLIHKLYKAKYEALGKVILVSAVRLCTRNTVSYRLYNGQGFGFWMS